MQGILLMLQNVLFDLDGTLTDPTEGIIKCMRYALDKLGRPYPEKSELVSSIGVSIHPTFIKLLNSDDEKLIGEGIRFFRERYSTVGLFENKVYPGIKELLDTLRKDEYRLYIVTNKPMIYTDKIIRRLSLNQFFPGIFAPELGDINPSKTDLIESALSNLNMKPKETIMIGDRKEDIIAGKSNGIITIGVTYGYGSEEEIIDAAPNNICREPYEIQTAIKNAQL